MKLLNIIKPIFSLTLTGLILLSSQAAMALPKAFQANYTVSKGSMTLGNLHTALKYSGNKYSYHKYTKATGFAALLTGIKITENTDGVFSGQNIKPTSYYYKQAKRTKDKVDRVQFSNNKATGSYKKKSFNIAIAQGTQDQASMELSLARDLGLNKQRLQYTVINRGKKSQQNFQKLGNELLKTPAGTFNTIKVKVVRSSTKRETIFWMAKEMDFMPVKIRHREKNDVITTIIKNYKKL